MPIQTDEESATLVQDLLHPAMVRDAAISRLHGLLLRVARAEAGRHPHSGRPRGLKAR
jgi:hypothetical protein